MTPYRREIIYVSRTSSALGLTGTLDNMLRYFSESLTETVNVIQLVRMTVP